MGTRRFLVLAGPFLVIAAFLAVGIACNETEPELVEDDDTEAAQTDDSDDGNDTAADPDADDAETSSDAGESDAAADDSSDLEEAEGFAVGDRVRMGDLVMVLHGVRWDDGGEFISPDEGERWLVADIEIVNESDESTSISTILMFDLIDQDNRSRDIAFMAETEGSLDGELGAGRAIRGDIAWEVVEGQTEWELIFSPELFGFGQAIFDISESGVQ